MDGASTEGIPHGDARRRRLGEWKRQFEQYNPPTRRYWVLRAVWSAAVVAAIVFFAVAFSIRFDSSTAAPYIFLGMADASLILAGVLECTKIKKERRRYQEVRSLEERRAARAQRKRAKAPSSVRR